MSEIKSVYTKQEITMQQVQNFMDKQNAIRLGKEGTPMDALNGQMNRQQDSLQISSEAQMMLEQLERMREDNEEGSKMAKKQAKCFLIAMRIAAGDEVPQSDIKFLIKYNMGLYAKAMQMRIPKAEPEEYDTVLSEEEEQEMSEVEMPEFGGTYEAEC